MPLKTQYNQRAKRFRIIYRLWRYDVIGGFADKISIRYRNLQNDGTAACRAQTVAGEKPTDLGRQPEKVLPIFLDFF